jgi:hypothetical protein
VPHDIEGAIGEGREVAHIALDDRHIDAIVGGGLEIAPKLGLAEVEHGHPRAEEREGGRLLPAAPGQT